MFGRLEVVLTQAAQLTALGRAQEPFGGTISQLQLLLLLLLLLPRRCFVLLPTVPLIKVVTPYAATGVLLVWIRVPMPLLPMIVIIQHLEALACWLYLVDPAQELCQTPVEPVMAGLPTGPTAAVPTPASVIVSLLLPPGLPHPLPPGLPHPLPPGLPRLFPRPLAVFF